MARKTEVYSWRVSPALKTSLEEAARRQRLSVARLLDEIVEGHLASGEADGSDADQQRRLHERAARFAGCIAGRQTNRAANVRQLVQARLRRLRRAS